MEKPKLEEYYFDSVSYIDTISGKAHFYEGILKTQEFIEERILDRKFFRKDQLQKRYKNMIKDLYQYEENYRGTNKCTPQEISFLRQLIYIVEINNEEILKE